MKRNYKKYDNFVEMECPICHEYYFVDDTDFEKSLPDYEGHFDYCHHCGWIYDIDQTQNPDLPNKSNDLSLNEYKKNYEQLIKENPNYDYCKATYIKKSHICPVCNKYEFEDVGCFDICPYCGWEDDIVQLNDPDFEGGANDLSLNQYKEQYKEIIKGNPYYKWEKHAHIK